MPRVVRMVLHIKTGLKHLKDDKLYEAFKSTIEDAFHARGYSIVPGFFESLENEDVAYVVLDIIENSVGGVLLALHQQGDEVMKQHGLDDYIEINKIAVLPERWNNGTLAGLMYAAKKVDFSPGGKKLPTAWRTSDAEVSKRYNKHSEFGGNPAIIGDYFVHGFGFKAVANGADPRGLFEHTASLIAAKPTTIIKTENSLYMPQPLENIIQA